jgi:hypothetical protein
MTTTDDLTPEPVDTGTLALRCGDLRAERDEARAQVAGIRGDLEHLVQQTRLILLDRLEGEMQAALFGWSGSNRDDRRRRAGLRQALEIVRAARTPIDERDAGTREREAQDG